MTKKIEEEEKGDNPYEERGWNKGLRRLKPAEDGSIIHS